MEVWKIYPGFPDYQFSSYGRVKMSKVPKPRFWSRVDIRLVNGANRKNIESKKVFALLFVPNPNNYKCVRIIDKQLGFLPHNLKWYRPDKGIKGKKLEHLKKLIKTDLQNIEIADILGLSEKTVRNYKKKSL